MISRPFTLSSLPTSAKLLLTLFLALVGGGYLAALGNLYHQYALADGNEGFTLDDLRVTFHGMEIPLDQERTDRPATGGKSRMLEMVEPGGDMRKNVTKGGAASVRALESWLARGALESEFNRKSLEADGDPSAEDVIARHCLRCHNAEDGEKADTPYGPDIFTVDYGMVYRYAAPGTARAPVADTGAEALAVKTIGPQTIPHLFLITHIHMLSIPLFTLLVSGLFLLTATYPACRGFLAPIPMLSLVVDFSCWWLARLSEWFVYVIAASGAVYGVTLAIQLLAVVASLWLARKRVATSPYKSAELLSE